MIHSSYLTPALNIKQTKSTVLKACRTIKAEVFPQCHPSTLGIAFCGMSGACIAPIIAYKFGANPVLVRKPTDTSHSWYKLEGNNSITHWIFIDDFISSGQTLQYVYQTMNKGAFTIELARKTWLGNKVPVFLGAYLYARSPSWLSPDMLKTFTQLP